VQAVAIEIRHDVVLTLWFLWFAITSAKVLVLYRAAESVFSAAFRKRLTLSLAITESRV